MVKTVVPEINPWVVDPDEWGEILKRHPLIEEWQCPVCNLWQYEECDRKKRIGWSV